ncbi:DeoR/GlpR family DNA-binding transcription regulator [Gymnodinialimonas sp. 2305UL16-5]|uniref:DeoR/GlpR family DNA-binding transcription regulator n=1 Tax=Gymnodinialimonas mytili TaxID=3126503 RepID=UPI003095112E
MRMTAAEKPEDLIAAIASLRGSGTRKMQAIAAAAADDPERFIRDSSKELCARLDASEPTLIRFCQSFGYSGLSDFRIDLALAYARNRRGIGLVEPLAQDRRNVNRDAKMLIAQAALPLIAGDQTLLIDNGSTAECFAECLAEAQPLTVMTTSLTVAHILLTQGHHEVMLTGGRVRPNARALSGRLVEVSLAEFRFDTLIMGADSIDPKSGLSTFREDEAQVNRALLAGAERAVALADSTKFGKPSLHRICGFEALSHLVTNLDETDDNLEAIRQTGLQVQIAHPHSQEAAE